MIMKNQIEIYLKYKKLIDFQIQELVNIMIIHLKICKMLKIYLQKGLQ